MASGSKVTPDFHLVENALSLLPILKTRLPVSSNICNMVLSHEKFKKEMNFYVIRLESMAEDDQWILARYMREDFGSEACISTLKNPKITDEIEEIFSNSKFFNWTDQYVWISFEPEVTKMLEKISVQKNSPNSSVPAFLYHYPLDNPRIEGQRSLLSLNSKEGIEFFMKTWKFSIKKTESYLRNVLGKLPSVGIISEGRVISGILTVGNGMMGMLYTDENFRKQNFGKICMQQLIQELRNGGYYPASVVEEDNHVSQNFHAKVGMKQVTHLDYILHAQPTE